MAIPKQALSSSATIATAPRIVSKTEAEALDQAIRGHIADRAYQLYENSGYTQGHDREHWLRAESEILDRGLEVRESGSWLAVNGWLDQASPDGVEIYVDAKRIVVRAKKGKESDISKSSALPPEKFLIADLHAEVEPITATAAIKDGRLTLMVKKRALFNLPPIHFADAH